MSNGDRNALKLFGEQPKDTTPDPTNRVRLAALRGYLRGLPSLDFTTKGRSTVCARFHVDADELAEAVAAQRARLGRPIPVRTIGAAVGRPKKAKGGAGPC